jgi:hypothetical protein
MPPWPVSFNKAPPLSFHHLHETMNPSVDRSLIRSEPPRVNYFLKVPLLKIAFGAKPSKWAFGGMLPIKTITSPAFPGPLGSG